MDFEKEFGDIKNAEGSSSFISEPGVYLVKITGVKFSEEDAEYDKLVKKGEKKPYLEAELETTEGKKSTARFYRVISSDSEDSKKIKNSRIKDFFTNARANFNLKGTEAMKSAIGNKLNCLFAQEEYISRDKNNNNKPEIRTIVKYSFSKREDETIVGNQNYLIKRLKAGDMEKFNTTLAEWEKHNGTSIANSSQSQANTSTLNIDDDLPF